MMRFHLRRCPCVSVSLCLCVCGHWGCRTAGSLLQAINTQTPSCSRVCMCVRARALARVFETLKTLQTFYKLNPQRLRCLHAFVSARVEAYCSRIPDCSAGTNAPQRILPHLCLSSALDKDRAPLCSLPPLLDIC